jgi:hypothetical protein
MCVLCSGEGRKKEGAHPGIPCIAQEAGERALVRDSVRHSCFKIPLKQQFVEFLPERVRVTLFHPREGHEDLTRVHVSGEIRGVAVVVARFFLIGDSEFEDVLN